MKNHLLRWLGGLSLLYWIWVSFNVTSKTNKNIRVLSRFIEFLSSEVAFYLNKLPHKLAWNTIAMSGLVFRIATWICCIDSRNWYVKSCWSCICCFLESLTHPWNIAFLSQFYSHCFWECLFEVVEISSSAFFFHGNSTRYSNKLHDFSTFLFWETFIWFWKFV